MNCGTFSPNPHTRGKSHQHHQDLSEGKRTVEMKEEGCFAQNVPSASKERRQGERIRGKGRIENDSKFLPSFALFSILAFSNDGFLPLIMSFASFFPFFKVSPFSSLSVIYLTILECVFMQNRFNGECVYVYFFFFGWGAFNACVHAHVRVCVCVRVRVCVSVCLDRQLVGALSPVNHKGKFRAKNKFLSVSQLFSLQVSKAQILFFFFF